MRNLNANGLMTAIKERGNLANHENLPCFHVPNTPNEHYLVRHDILCEVSTKLDPSCSSHPSGLRSLALHGVGGAGKTQIALQYACRSRDKFDAVLWISADGYTQMTESFLDASLHLGLVKKASSSLDPIEAMTITKRWLSDTRCSWLLIFDNADSLDVLQQGWPRAASGAILITTRDSGAASHPASHGIHVTSLDTEQGTRAFMKILGEQYQGDDNLILASEISEMLGGLPLALNQMAKDTSSSYIKESRISLGDFLPRYKKHQKILHDKVPNSFDYNCTVATIWKLSVDRLPSNSATLLRLVSFFDPDKIDESMLADGAKHLVSTQQSAEFKFFTNEFDLEEAQKPLFKAALLDRNPDTRALSLHRLVQAAVIHDLESREKMRYLTDSIKIMVKVFPDAWDDDSDGFTYSKWDMCRRCLPHVINLSKRVSNEIMEEKHALDFISLLLRCAWYFHENEDYAASSEMITSCRSIVQRHSLSNTLQNASVVGIQGLIELDLGDSSTAVEHLLEALRLKQTLYSSLNTWNIAATLCNIGIAYMEMGQTDLSMDFHTKALRIRERINCRLLGNSYCNIAALLVRMGKPEEAENMYRNGPGMETFNDDDLLREDKPRWSSNLQLLSMIREQQGRIEDALKLALKLLHFRKAKFGGRFKTCDSLCRVGHLLLRLNQPAAALKVFQECIFNAASLRFGEGYMALAHYRTHLAYTGLGKAEQAAEHFEEALAARKLVLVRNKKLLDAEIKLGDQDHFIWESLVPFVLW